MICSDMGHISIIIGCMFSGKSTEMIRQYKRYSSINKNVLLVNHQSDTRYGEQVVASHDQVKVNCVSCDNLLEIRHSILYKMADIVMVEEAQFFPHLYEFVTYAADHHQKTVIVSGLDGDFQRKPFGDILRLIPHAESVTKLRALCKVCNDGTPGCFTKRIVEGNEQKLVGGVEAYIPVCRKHYHDT